MARNLAESLLNAVSSRAAAAWHVLASGDPAYGNPPPAAPVPLETPIGPVTPAKLETPEDLSTRTLAQTYHHFPVQPLPEEWTIDSIRSARQLHDEGQFWHSVRLRDALTTDPRVAGALEQAIAAPTTLPWRAVASDYRGGRGVSDTARAEAEAMIAPSSSACPPHVVRALVEDLRMYGVAIAQLIWTPRADGSRWDIRLEQWPMQYAWWNATLRTYQLTSVEGLLTVRHGDGKWIVLEPYGLRSWMRGAVRSLAIPWADRSYGIRFRSQFAAVHGSPAPIGTLPNRINLASAQAAKFVALIKALRDGRAAGVKPEGSTIEYLEAKTTTGGQVFRDIVACSNEDIQYALHGIDGSQGAKGVYTPPSLQGVRFDLVELFARTIDVGLTTGMLLPWTLANFGDARICPRFERLIPDLEKEQRDASVARQHEAFARAVMMLRQAGFTLTQDYVEQLASLYGVAASTLTEGGPLPLPKTPQPNEAAPRPANDLPKAA